ncbi:hypothetical protein [Chroococcidiopsis sp. TS-821]|uniref:hypothetical protein n=1 Tax=Chroococcidiopsis sp. TS-821 TaxID=1378066 RepID=UPI000CEEC1A9|nr:hypothetical protein [Chroococcidiopsis sp. TS-821]PPS39806.1 hypothetical protein B1A85_21630 [Chroococcidiopsis sp. TS-821]
MTHRDLFARSALANIPKILTLLDRNPHSPTYGCFDRNFWHYKIIDFPSGMAQEFVLPLALAYDTDVPDNPFYRQPVLRDWVEAGIIYAAKSAHKDGSCDDYFPYERASGAAAFSLLACIDSYVLFKLNNSAILQFFARRADWLASHQESGRLSNHQALITLCLLLLSHLLQTTRWQRAIAQRLELVLSWQSSEGWFQEYEGCDPGYNTMTISCLARIYQLQPDTKLKEALIKAVKLAAHFVHPDGSYGGEYASRNTYNFFPHGFELIGRWMPEALQISDRFLEGLAKGLAPCYADDHIIGHHTWNYLLAWRDFVPQRPTLTTPPQGRLWLKEAKILIDRREDTALYLALNKGGVFKLFRNNQLVISDTQVSLQVEVKNKLKNCVAHLVDTYEINISENEITIAGAMGWAKQKQMTPANLLVLRTVMLTVGRFFPNLIRKILQKILITGKQNAPYYFRRKLRWSSGHWYVTDEVYTQSWHNVIYAGIGGDQTSIYVVMSRTFQRNQMRSWFNLTQEVRKLAPGEPLKLERSF